jgi:Zn-dependent M28 family amino/carboxypeptidase
MKLERALRLLLLPLLVTACSAPSQTEGDASASGASSAASTITATGLLRDVEVLSDDAMAGRGTGTAGEIAAAAYLEKRFQEIGLAPLAGSYRQDFELVGTRKIADASTISISNSAGALALAATENVSFWSSSQKPSVDIADAPLVFVGYGVEAPEYGWDDFKGLDASGKVLLFLNDDPQVAEDGKELFGGEARTYYGRWTYKYEQAMRHGAAGAIIVHTTESASYPWSVVQYNGVEEHFALDLEGTGYKVDLLGWLDSDTSNQVAAAIGTSLEGLFEMAAKRDFQPVDTGYVVNAHLETEIRRSPTSNVVGILEGSDEELASQVIVFSAHYDHLGTNPDLEGDQIFNGAWDNAAGTASLLQLAQAFAKAPERPRRSLLFLACAAEEKGSLGSQWFVQRPPFERSRLVANFNVDMPQIFGVTRDMAAIGNVTNSLGATLSEVAAKWGVEITGDPRPRAGSFYRSDQVNFAKAGVPALFILPGGDYEPALDFDPSAYRDQHYHQVSDEIRDEWNLAGAERDLRLLYDTATRVANADEMPTWVQGNEFEEAWKDLHGLED